jgi:transposase
MNMTMDMTMSSIRPNLVEVVTSVQRRRRWTPEQKLEIVKQTNEPGSSVSLVARQHGLTAAQLFQWRKAYLEGLWSQSVPMKPLSQLLNFKRP